MLAHSAGTTWSFEPLQLVALALGAALYAKRARTLARRGTPVAWWRPALFGLGIALIAVSLVSPVAELGETESFAFHMVQHLLLGDLGPLCIVAGLTGPILRPLLSVRAIRALRFLAHPLVALPLWTLNLLLWHLPFFWEAALRNEAVHALEHVSFFTAGALMWAAVIEVLPGPEWFGTAAKMGYVVVVRIVSTILGNVFVWAGTPFYGIYEDAHRPFGLSAEADQGIAGGIMMIEGSLVTIGVLAWLFLRLAQEGELRQELLERGLDPRSVRRAVRYGRGKELSQVALTLYDPPGLEQRDSSLRTRGLKGERMATPPEQTSRPAYGYTAGSTLDLARLPIPGNAEFLIYVVVMIVFGLIALIDDHVSAGQVRLGRDLDHGRLLHQPRARKGDPRPRAVSLQVSWRASLGPSGRLSARGESWPSAVIDGR